MATCYACHLHPVVSGICTQCVNVAQLDLGHLPRLWAWARTLTIPAMSAGISEPVTSSSCESRPPGRIDLMDYANEANGFLFRWASWTRDLIPYMPPEDDNEPVSGPPLKPGQRILGRAALIARYLPYTAWSPRSPRLAADLTWLVDRGVKMMRMGSPKMLYIQQPCPFCENMSAYHTEARGFECKACYRVWGLGTADDPTTNTRNNHHHS